MIMRMPQSSRPLVPPPRGVTQSDVSYAADSLLREGIRPTIEKIRQKIGKGSPNTINPLLDAWWKTLSARLDSGPAALHRLPESIAHIAEALWMQALDEGRRRAHQELKTSERVAADHRQNLEVRSHVLSLREGELDSRLRDREKTITELNQRLSELALLLRKEQATRESLIKQLSERQAARPTTRAQRRLARTVTKRPKAASAKRRKITAKKRRPHVKRRRRG
jgi:uncharacterized coiled-coil protein SlyX